MKIKVTCPNDPNHNRFSVTAHVSQEWEVDSAAQFSRCIQESIDTVHAPDAADFYLCLVCSVQAKAELVPNDPIYPAYCEHCGCGLDKVGDKCDSDECPSLTNEPKDA